MPKRPPKSWWKRCVRRVKQAGNAVSPERVCGAAWRDKSPAKKRARQLCTRAETGRGRA